MANYKVMVQKSFGGRVNFYCVTNKPNDWDNYESKWTNVAEFPVGVGQSDEDQRRRAYEYCDYMNKATPVQPPIGALR